MVNKGAFGFGATRFVLASLVAASHLWADMTQGFAAYAVWAFFVLSGFLMTLVLTTKYGFDGSGLRAYAFNRFMRIFPLYWLAVAMGLLTLLYYNGIGVDLRKLNGEFHMPVSLRDWSYVLTLFPGIQRGGLPVPVANALAIEVGFYMLMPMLASGRGAALFGVVLGAWINLNIGIIGDTFGERYSTFLPCLLPFAVGSLICQYRERLTSFAMPMTSALAWVLHGLLWYKLPGWPWEWGLYVSVVLSAWLVISMYQQPSGRLDKMLGDLSYPIYLIHTTVAAWFLCMCGINRDLRFFAVGFAATVAVSWAIVILIDRPLARLKWKPKAPRVEPQLVGATG